MQAQRRLDHRAPGGARDRAGRQPRGARGEPGVAVGDESVERFRAAHRARERIVDLGLPVEVGGDRRLVAREQSAQVGLGRPRGRRAPAGVAAGRAKRDRARQHGQRKRERRIDPRVDAREPGAGHPPEQSQGGKISPRSTNTP